MKYAKSEYPARSHELLRNAPLTGIAPLRSHCEKVLDELWVKARNPESATPGAAALDLVRVDNQTYADYFTNARAPVALVLARLEKAPKRVSVLTGLLRAMRARNLLIGDPESFLEIRIKSYVAYFNLSQELQDPRSRLSYDERDYRRALMSLHELNMTLEREKYAAAVLSVVRHETTASAPLPSDQDIIDMFAWADASEDPPTRGATTTDADLERLVDGFYANDKTAIQQLFPLTLPTDGTSANALRSARMYMAAGKDPWAAQRGPLARGWTWRPALDPAGGEYVVAFERTATMELPGPPPDEGYVRGTEGTLIPFVGYPGNWQHGEAVEIVAPELRCVRTGALYTEAQNHARAASWTRERHITLPSGEYMCKKIRVHGWFSADSDAPYADGDESLDFFLVKKSERTEDELIDDAATLWYGPHEGWLPYDPAEVIVVPFTEEDEYDATPAGQARLAFFDDLRARMDLYMIEFAAHESSGNGPIAYAVRGPAATPAGKYTSEDVTKTTRPAGGLLAYYYLNFNRLLNTEALTAAELAYETRRLIAEYEKDEHAILVNEAAFLHTLTLGDARFAARTKYATWFGIEKLEGLMDTLDVVLAAVLTARGSPRGFRRVRPTEGGPERVSVAEIVEFATKERIPNGTNYDLDGTLRQATRIARAVLSSRGVIKTAEDRGKLVDAAGIQATRPHIRPTKIDVPPEIDIRMQVAAAGARTGLTNEFILLVLPVITDAIWYVLKTVKLVEYKEEVARLMKEAWEAVTASAAVVEAVETDENTPLAVRAFGRAMLEFMREFVYYTADVRLGHTQREIFRDLGEL